MKNKNFIFIALLLRNVFPIGRFMELIPVLRNERRKGFQYFSRE